MYMLCPACDARIEIEEVFTALHVQREGVVGVNGDIRHHCAAGREQAAATRAPSVTTRPRPCPREEVTAMS
jgi:hypothetical protein